MSETGEIFLGIIAFAVLVMAVIQVAAVVAALRLAKRVDALAEQIDQEIKPLIANLTALSSEAARAAALAAAQAERFDRVFGEMAARVDQTLAIMSGAKAVIEAFRGLREASRRRAAPRSVVDEEESLFIG